MVKIYSEKEYIDRSGLPAKVLRIIGVPIYTMKISKGWRKHKYLLGLLKIREKEAVRQIYILGIKVWQRKDKLKELKLMNEHILRRLQEQNDRLDRKLNDFQRETVNKIQTAALVASQHSKVFPQFKNKHKGEVGVLVATAPTMLYYEPIKNAIHFGVNTSYQNEKINLDYWLALDLAPIKPYIDEIQKKDFVKFFGQVYEMFPYCYYDAGLHIPDEVIENSKNSFKYYLEHGNYNQININIEQSLLPDLRSCVFQALYIMLYMGLKKIYIVGCDASATGYFNNDKQPINQLLVDLPKSWKLIKSYIENFYPDVEIISVNPVGLKGLFRDVYTQSYLDSNPEIKEKLGDDIEILEVNKRED